MNCGTNINSHNLTMRDPKGKSGSRDVNGQPVCFSVLAKII